MNLAETFQTDRTKCSASPVEGATKLVTSTLAGLLFLVSAGTNAVQVSSSGTGQALIVPIYSTEGGFDTLLAVSNTQGSRDFAIALKVNFIGGDEQIAGSFNVYLRSLSTWGLGLTNVNGRTVSGPFTGGCVLQAGPGGDPEVVDSLQLDSTFGYIEIVEMGSVTDAALVQAASDGDCEVFQQYWMDILASSGKSDAALDAPRGMARANISLINVARGTMYSVEATALANFRDSELHTAPGMMAPDLSSADNGPEVTTSTNCYVSPCVVDEWSDPVDAVSAALMAREITGEYAIPDAIRARTEWLLTMPTMRFSSNPDSAIRNSFAILLLTDRQGRVQPAPPQPIIGPQPPFRDSFGDLLAIDNAITFMHFTEKSDPDPADSILSTSATGSFLVPSEAAAGLARAGFTVAPTFSTPVLTSLGGRDYFGIPAIGVVFQEFNNGVIPSDNGGFRIASFGGSFEPNYSLEKTE